MGKNFIQFYLCKSLYVCKVTLDSYIFFTSLCNCFHNHILEFMMLQFNQSWYQILLQFFVSIGFTISEAIQMSIYNMMLIFYYTNHICLLITNKNDLLTKAVIL